MTGVGVALVTGGSRGIGLAIADALAASGHAVAIAARSEDALAAAAERLARHGAPVAQVAVDLTDPDAPAALLAEVEARLGPVTALVNNAGTAPSAKIERTTDADLDQVLDLHVKAPFRLFRSLLPQWLASERGGVCVQLASTVGLSGCPMVSAYVAAKHAMVGLVRAWAAELRGKPVRVYGVCPGFVDTDITRTSARKVASFGRHTEAEVLDSYGGMNACGRLITPDEVARAVQDFVDPSCDVPSGKLCVLDAMPPSMID